MGGSIPIDGFFCYLKKLKYSWFMGFPDSSAGKESACNVEDLSSILGLERSPGEGRGYPLPYSWAFLVAQDSKELTCNVGDLGLIPGSGRSPGGGNGNPSSILVWRIPLTEKPGGLPSMGSQRVRHDWVTEHNIALSPLLLATPSNGI